MPYRAPCSRPPRPATPGSCCMPRPRTTRHPIVGLGAPRLPLCSSMQRPCTTPLCTATQHLVLPLRNHMLHPDAPLLGPPQCPCAPTAYAPVSLRTYPGAARRCAPGQSQVAPQYDPAVRLRAPPCYAPAPSHAVPPAVSCHNLKCSQAHLHTSLVWYWHIPVPHRYAAPTLPLVLSHAVPLSCPAQCHSAPGLLRTAALHRPTPCPYIARQRTARPLRAVELPVRPPSGPQPPPCPPCAIRSQSRPLAPCNGPVHRPRAPLQPTHPPCALWPPPAPPKRSIPTPYTLLPNLQPPHARPAQP